MRAEALRAEALSIGIVLGTMPGCARGRRGLRDGHALDPRGRAPESPGALDGVLVFMLLRAFARAYARTHAPRNARGGPRRRWALQRRRAERRARARAASSATVMAQASRRSRPAAWSAGHRARRRARSPRRSCMPPREHRHGVDQSAAAASSTRSASTSTSWRLLLATVRNASRSPRRIYDSTSKSVVCNGRGPEPGRELYRQQHAIGECQRAAAIAELVGGRRRRRSARPAPHRAACRWRGCGAQLGGVEQAAHHGPGRRGIHPDIGRPSLAVARQLICRTSSSGVYSGRPRTRCPGRTTRARRRLDGVLGPRRGQRAAAGTHEIGKTILSSSASRPAGGTRRRARAGRFANRHRREDARPPPTPCRRARRESSRLLLRLQREYLAGERSPHADQSWPTLTASRAGTPRGTTGALGARARAPDGRAAAPRCAV